MSKKLKIAITVATSVLIIVIVIISTFFIVKHFKYKEKIDNIIEDYSDENIQDRLDNEAIKSTDDLMQQIDGEYVIGVIKIDKIGFSGLVYKGTSLDTLSKGVGHFDSSPYLNGNVCLAAHNTSKYWAKLHTLKKGDKIIYTSFLGTKEYSVTDMLQISETDWTKLSNTTENMLTLLTCVKGKPTQRLCVQALETD
ncbi:MAG: class D sortase [Clostridia bacterium]|jgi:LPXTG-site transpeptidase (sortase) family protein|nr:class D sortase [Clostridia bacterium]